MLNSTGKSIFDTIDEHLRTNGTRRRMARKGRSKGQGTLFKREGRGPWLASWFDHRGKRRELSTRTTDRAAAERILAKHVAGTALRREGVIDPAKDRFATEGRKPIVEHVEAYVAHCKRSGQAPAHVAQKAAHLARLVESARVARLDELNADALELHLSTMTESGLSARSVNFARQIAVAFLAWCTRTGRAETNPLRTVAKLDESRDRRRIRRALTADELTRLLAVARERGREAWYLGAALAGLRKGDLQRLTWSDVDFEAGTLTIRGGKAKREDSIPMHPQLAAALRARLVEFPSLPGSRVFPETVRDRTRVMDFLRAGIAHVVVEQGPDGKRRERVSLEDAEGRFADLHALRTTLGTNLARAGVAPQIARQIMRHSDYGTTLRHYTALGLGDTSAAMAAIPSIGPRVDERETVAATGTDGAAIDAQEPQRYPQRLPQQLARHDVRDDARVNASTRDDGARSVKSKRAKPSGETASSCDSERELASLCNSDAGVSQLVESQLPKLSTHSGSTDADGTCDGSSPTPSDSPSDSNANRALDPDLAGIAQVWPQLTAEMRAGIVALVRSMTRA